MPVSAAAIISRAEAFGVTLLANGDRLRCGSVVPMPPALRDLLREHKPAIIKELEQRQSLVSEAPPVQSPAPEPTTTVRPRGRGGNSSGARPPMTQPPLAVSRRLAEALTHAARYHVQFWLDEAGVFVTQPPRDYKPAIQAAERALMACQDEIKMICKLPERPKHFEDQGWVRAVADSARLGYRNWRED
jgi:hypothetical protein